jgi:hypothetical protein
VLIAAGNRQTRPIPAAPACHHVGPKPLAAIAARATALYLLLGHFALGSAPLSRAPHTNTHSVAVRSASCVRTSASYLDVFREEVVGYKEQLRTRPPRHEAQPAAAALKCLSTTPHSSPAQRRTVEIRTLSRVSAPQPATTAHVLTSHHASGDGSSNSSALVCSAALCCSAANAVLRVVRDEDAADLGHESARARSRILLEHLLMSDSIEARPSPSPRGPELSDDLKVSGL